MKKFLLPLLLITAIEISLSGNAQGPCPENVALTVTTTNMGNGYVAAQVRITWDFSNKAKKTLVIRVNNSSITVVDISKLEGEYEFPTLLFFPINGPAMVSATIYSGGNEKKECWTDTWAHFIIDPQPPF